MFSYIKKSLNSNTLSRLKMSKFQVLMKSLSITSSGDKIHTISKNYKKTFHCNWSASSRVAFSGYSNDRHNPAPLEKISFTAHGTTKQADLHKAFDDSITFVFNLKNGHSISDIKKTLNPVETLTHHCDYILYPDLKNKHVWYYVFPTADVLNVNQYRAVTGSFIHIMAPNIKMINIKASESPLESSPLINKSYYRHTNSISYQNKERIFHIDKGFLLETLDPIKRLDSTTKKSKKKIPGLYQNIVLAAKYFVSENNPNQYGRKIFSSLITPAKIKKYKQKVEKAEQHKADLDSKCHNSKDKNYPKTEIDKAFNQVKKARKIYRKNESNLHNRNRIIESVANADIKGDISDDTAKSIMKIFEHVRPNNSKDIKGQYNNALLALGNSINKSAMAEPISEALRLYQKADDSISIGTQFHQIMGKDFKPNTKATTSEVAATIELIYPPVIIKSSQQNPVKNVAIFDSLCGYWTHNKAIFSQLLGTITGAVSSRSLTNLMETLSTWADSHKRYIEPYNGNRYLLYHNGVYDTAQPVNKKTGQPDQLIPLNSNLVHDLHFTERAYHKIDLEVDPVLPQYDALSDKSGQGDAMWNPIRMLKGYCNNDNHIYNYFLFCLSLGLFSTHNFGVSLDIQGPSGNGKTILSTIYEDIFGTSRVNIAPFANLNGRFVFTSYKDNTAIIWFDETNTDSKPLGSRGIATYDSLNDDQARFEVKGKSDYLLDNPPMVILDGTDFLKTEHPDTGPYRRTLVMKLPNDLSEADKKKFYANNFKRLLKKPDVAAWFNWHMIKAYREKTSVSDRKSDLKLNMTSNKVKKIVPKKALEWRENLQNHDNNLTEWFTEVLEPCLVSTIDDQNPRNDLSRVQKSFMYHLYQHHMFTQYNQHINDFNGDSVSKFWTLFISTAEERNWRLVRIKSGSQPRSKSRCRISRLSTTNIDFDKYQNIETLPPDYQNGNRIKKQPFGFLTAWYYIEKVPETHGKK